MGLPPSQGHNNLRLYHTTNYPTQHHNHRLYTNKHLYQQQKQQQFIKQQPYQEYQQQLLLQQQQQQQQLKKYHDQHFNQSYLQYYHPPYRYQRNDLYNKYSSFPRLRTGCHQHHNMYDDDVIIKTNLPQPQSKKMQLPPASRPNTLFRHNNRLHKSQPLLHNTRTTKNTNPLIGAISLSTRKLLRNSYPIISNMPLINRNSSLILINHSPFALRDPRFGILHHCAQSSSYY